VIELARFRWAGEEWCFAIGHDQQPRLLCSARDQRTYMILRARDVGRVVPVSCTTQAGGRTPWDGWFCSIVLLGEAERRLLYYPDWVEETQRREAARQAERDGVDGPGGGGLP
jgi:hypothetical protein